MAPARKKDADVTLDLDSLEREGVPLGPFVFKLGGRDYELGSPQDLDYRVLIDAMVAAGNKDLIASLNCLLDEDDRTDFWLNKIPAFKMEALVGGYMDHYELEIEEAKSDASPPSSRGTAGRSKRTSPSRA